MSAPIGLPGHKFHQYLTMEESVARIEVLKKLLNQRLDNKSARNESNASCLRKNLKFADLGGANALTREQWVGAFQRLGAQMAEADVDLLFWAFQADGGEEPLVDYHRFAEAMTTGVALGPLAGTDFVTMMSDRHGAKPHEGKRTYDKKLSIGPPPYALGDSEPNQRPHRYAAKTTNTPSVVGGIFAPPPPIIAPQHPSIKNSSTLSLAHSVWKPSGDMGDSQAFNTTEKRMSNTSSLPGGIFSAGTTEDFRVKGLFVRPGY
ncbi:hypothetical protein T492DRAFT_1007572 [Pavlovales sp. CCMP2436]|nr:hypothetical protein T492DRAFT_1007572 [Pavlovales sp. CCMP2436]